MADLFQNKYRISSARLLSWNYANAGMYLITICTKNRESYFGEITIDPGRDAMHGVSTINQTDIGKIAEIEWFKTPQLRPDMNIELGEFVVMPNHIHGIICVGKNEYNHEQRRDAMHGVSTGKTHTKTNLPHNQKILHLSFAFQICRYHLCPKKQY